MSKKNDSGAIPAPTEFTEQVKADAKAAHEKWLAEKIEEGFLIGEKVDLARKTHPCMKHFDQLSRDQQFEAYKAVHDDSIWQALTGESPNRPPEGFIKIADGPTTAYKDGPDGTIQVMACPMGWIPDTWKDTPAECKNNGGEHVPVTLKHDGNPPA